MHIIQVSQDGIHDSVATSHRLAAFRLNVMWIVAGNSVLDFSFKCCAKSRQGSFWLRDSPRRLLNSGCDPDCEGLTAGFSCLPEGAVEKLLELRYDGLCKLMKALRVQQASTVTPRVGFIVWIRRLLRSEVYKFALHYITWHYILTLHCIVLHYIALYCITLRHTYVISVMFPTISWPFMWNLLCHCFYAIWGVLISGSFQMTFGDCFACQWIIVPSAATHGPCQHRLNSWKVWRFFSQSESSRCSAGRSLPEWGMNSLIQCFQIRDDT